MKKIKNLLTQGLEVYLKSPKGPETIWLNPRETVQIPEEFIGSQLKNLAHRRMVKIS